MHKIELEGAEATAVLAKMLAAHVKPGDVIALIGPLGAGKTTFARGFIQAFFKEEEIVPSPTFTLVQHYDTTEFSIQHFDLYRIETKEELREIGLEDALEESVCLVEWPEIAQEYLPKDTLMLELTYGERENERVAMLSGSPRWDDVLNNAIK